MTRVLAPRHAEYSPSILGSLLPGRCPGRVRMERGVPEIDRGDGDFGRLAHRELAQILLMPQPSCVHIADHELRLLVGRCIAFAHTLGFLDYVPVETEHEVVIYASDGTGLTRGRVDLCRHIDSHVEAIDWKFAHQPIDEEGARAQLTAYLLGLMEEHDVVQARGSIYLPRLRRVHSFETTRDDALELVEGAIRGAQEPDAPLGAGEWCRYCRALSTCPEVRSKAAELLSAFDLPREVRERSKVTIREAATGELDEWIASGAVEQIARLSNMTAYLEPAIEALRAAVRALLEEGGDAATTLGKHWELKECRGKPRASADEFRAALDGVLTPEDFDAATELRLSTLEERFVKRLELEAKTSVDELPRSAARKMFHAALAHVAETPVFTQLRRKRR